MALVNKDQGGAGNGYKTLVMKAADVTVELSMAEFLNQFFHLWEEDAQYIATLLGYSDEIQRYDWETDTHKLQGKVTLMKSVKDISDNNPDFTLANLEKSKRESFLEILESFKESGIIIKNTQGDSKTPLGENLETPDEVDNMTTDNVEMIEKSAADAALEEVKKSAKEAKEALEAKDSELVELKKSLKAFQDAQAEAEKQVYVTKAKDFEILGVTEENAESFGVALMKMAKDEDLKVVSEILEKAVTISKSVEDFQVGVDTQVEAETGNSALAEILKAKFNK